MVGGRTRLVRWQPRPCSNPDPRRYLIHIGSNAVYTLPFLPSPSLTPVQLNRWNHLANTSPVGALERDERPHNHHWERHPAGTDREPVLAHLYRLSTRTFMGLCRPTHLCLSFCVHATLSQNILSLARASFDAHSHTRRCSKTGYCDPLGYLLSTRGFLPVMRWRGVCVCVWVGVGCGMGVRRGVPMDAPAPSLCPCCEPCTLSSLAPCLALVESVRRLAMPFG